MELNLHEQAMVHFVRTQGLFKIQLKAILAQASSGAGSTEEISV